MSGLPTEITSEADIYHVNDVQHSIVFVVYGSSRIVNIFKSLHRVLFL